MGLQNEKIAALSFVTADLNYLGPALDRPRTYTFEPPSGEPRSNIVPEPHSLPIHDLRPIAETVSLDREGFALVRQNSSVKDFYVLVIENGRIAHDIDVDIPRPRQRGSADLAALEGSILRGLLQSADDPSDL